RVVREALGWPPGPPGKAKSCPTGRPWNKPGTNSSGNILARRFRCPGIGAVIFSRPLGSNSGKAGQIAFTTAFDTLSGQITGGRLKGSLLESQGREARPACRASTHTGSIQSGRGQPHSRNLR